MSDDLNRWEVIMDRITTDEMLREVSELIPPAVLRRRLCKHQWDWDVLKTDVHMAVVSMPEKVMPRGVPHGARTSAKIKWPNGDREQFDVEMPINWFASGGNW